MAKKKKKPHKVTPTRTPSRDIPEFPDPRLLEGVMREWVGKQTPGTENTPLAKAQLIIDRTVAERSAERRVQMAKSALEICPDCADAYVLLAEHARTRKEALSLYEKGVAAGERALGAEAFQQGVGRFWGMLETRPYMRARLGYAHALWVAARREEAIQHLQDMLRLNPSDNQGIRYTLVGFLLFLDRDDDLSHLLQQYKDDATAAWAYSKALLSFRQHGDTVETQQLLAAARKRNKHVPQYLTGEKFPPAEQPGYYSIGDESEALTYVGGFLASWKSTPGAVAWLRAKVNKPKEAPQAKGPLGFIKKWLTKNLPQEPDVWQVDFRELPNWVKTGGVSVRPWALLVTSRSNDLVLAHQISEERPSAGLVWDALVQAMQNPAAGAPHRPTELQVQHNTTWDSLRRHIEEIGLQLTTCDELDQLAHAFQSMIEHVCGTPQPGLLDMPGMKPDQVGKFYEAAAQFFRLTPWKKVGYEAAIKIECDNYQSGPWYAVLMGQSGLTCGVALYDNLRMLQRMWAENVGDEESARKSIANSVTFGEKWECSIADLEACKKYGWEVARPDAYPAAIHKERGLSVRPPLVWELELLEGCLRTIPEFVTRRKQDDPTREEMTIPVNSGQLKLVLSWVIDEGGQ